MPRGSKPGERRGGRQVGAKNKRTKAIEQAAQATASTLSQTIPGAFQGDAHALLMAVYKDPSHDWEIRIDAAKAAVRFEKPSLASVESKVDGDMRHKVISAEPMSAEAWEATYGAPHAGVGQGHD